ncbi:uncharacterized protein LOC143275021 [Babylonia areolata]|uniref:uncharacterized protein LOC143275021 n=1 Tax=Babylonia areolata TaxID=304850 RepID=UPI003FD5229A
MDGPNVNWTVYNTINCDMKDNHGVSLLHVGSCGLHTLHNAFRTGCEATGWKIEDFLSASYKLFEDSPARLEDYYATTQASSLPLKFCRHRWLENVVPAMRAIELLPNLDLFVKAALTKKITLPRNNSFECVKTGVNNPLLPSQLSFFASVARLIEPFLKKYQADKPLMPFMATDLQTMLKNLMQRFIKEDVLTDTPLTQIDLEDANNLRARVQLDFKTTSLVNKAKKLPGVSEGLIRDFDKQCRSFLMKVVGKMIEKCPLKYGVARNMSCLDPTKLNNKEESQRKMSLLLKNAIDSGRVTEVKADTILQEFTNFLPTAATHSASSFNC